VASYLFFCAPSFASATAARGGTAPHHGSDAADAADGQQLPTWVPMLQQRGVPDPLAVVPAYLDQLRTALLNNTHGGGNGDDNSNSSSSSFSSRSSMSGGGGGGGSAGGGDVVVGDAFASPAAVEACVLALDARLKLKPRQMMFATRLALTGSAQGGE
jgi:hypothetical protein